MRGRDTFSVTRAFQKLDVKIEPKEPKINSAWFWRPLDIFVTCLAFSKNLLMNDTAGLFQLDLKIRFKMFILASIMSFVFIGWVIQYSFLISSLSKWMCVIKEFRFDKMETESLTMKSCKIWNSRLKFCLSKPVRWSQFYWKSPFCLQTKPVYFFQL